MCGKMVSRKWLFMGFAVVFLPVVVKCGNKPTVFPDSPQENEVPKTSQNNKIFGVGLDLMLEFFAKLLFSAITNLGKGYFDWDESANLRTKCCNLHNNKNQNYDRHTIERMRQDCASYSVTINCVDPISETARNKFYYSSFLVTIFAIIVGLLFYMKQ